MAQGIGLAGGYGAGGVRDALVDLIAQKMAQQQFEELKDARRVRDDQARSELDQRRAEMNTRAERESAEFAFQQKAHGEELGLRTKDYELRKDEAARRGQPEKPKTMTIRGVRDPKTGKPTTRVVSEDEAMGQSFEEYVAPREPREPRDERLVQIAGPDGNPIWVRESQAVGKGAPRAPKPVTGAERDSVAFYNRAKKANDALALGGLEERIAKQGAMGALWGEHAPSLMQSEDQQRYKQARLAFTEAFLREQSGAAIANSEYDRIGQIYFGQPGDSPETIKQKQQMRQAAIDGLKNSSGKAFDEFYGEGESAGAPGAPGDPGKGQQFDFDPKTGTLVPRGGR